MGSYQKINGIIGALVLLLSASGAASAATYYVATNGSDSNAGTNASPFNTIKFAYRKVGPGDTIIVKPGVYTEKLSEERCFLFDKTASGAAPITIKSETTWGAVLDGGGSCRTIIWLNGNNHVIEGFEMRNAAHDGMVIYGEGYNKIISNNIHNNGNDGANLPPPAAVSSGITQARTQGDQFIGNYIHNNGRKSSHAEFAQNLDHGMYMHGVDMLIMNNIVSNNRDHGIQLAGNGGNLSNARIYNNVLASNGRSGIVFWKDISNPKVINNIFYNNGKGRAIDSYEPNVNGATFDRNIFFGHTTNIDVTGSGFTIGTNQTIDPQFVNAGSGDFGLQSTSPAIDAGIVAPLGFDFAGAARPQGAAYDIGVFEGAGSKMNILPAVSGLLPLGAGGAGSGGGLFGNCTR